MKVLIIEDELYAIKRLEKLLFDLEPSWEVIARIDEVKLAVHWLKNNPAPDVIFMDIQLADGFSFDIFEHTKISSPVIFTTAFDQYALKAFEVNGIDYLLKPLEEEKLKNAVQKIKNNLPKDSFDYSKIANMIQNNDTNRKDRFLVKKNDEMWFVQTPDIAYFNSESSYTFLYTKKGNKYILDNTLEEILNQLDKKLFFQINRNMIIRLESIIKIHTYFNGRYKLDISPQLSDEIIVSRTRSKNFKDWLGS